MYPISDKGLNREDEKSVYFFTSAYHPLDNFSAHSISIWNRNFPTAEHAFQWKKFSDIKPDIAEKILEAKSPHLVKEISIVNKDLVSKDWHNIKLGVMEEILKAKAKQHEDVREVLRKTGRKTIVENSPVDSFWGIGPDEKGENMLGKIWMKIRDN